MGTIGDWTPSGVHATGTRAIDSVPVRSILGDGGSQTPSRVPYSAAWDRAMPSLAGCQTTIEAIRHSGFHVFLLFPFGYLRLDLSTYSIGHYLYMFRL